MRYLTSVAFILMACLSSYAAPRSAGMVSDSTKKITYEEYIAKYSKIAISNMKEYKIPASITLAQGLLESGAGNSDLARNANNHFGIKCHTGWKGESYIKDDDAKDECFRKYKNPEESFEDHAIFLTTRSRYASLFELKTTDYKGWAKGLKAAGYATNPAYADRLITLIDKYELYQFDGDTTLHTPRKPGLFHRKSNTIVDKERDHRHEISINNHVVQKNNGVKYVVVQPGENFKSLADALQIRPWMLLGYNDMGKDDTVKEGDMVYLQSKKRKGSTETHTVQQGETLHSISQKHGIRLKNLAEYNNLQPNDTVAPGVVLHLRKK